MVTVAQTDTSNMMAALRLLEMERKEGARRAGEHVEEKSALDYFEEDQALISASAYEAQLQGEALSLPIENVNLNLSELKQPGNVKKQPSQPDAAFELIQRQSVEIQLEIRYHSAAPIDGLKVYDQNYAESDRYLFKFTDGYTFTILDKWTSKSSTIWGDPHVDLNDMEGNLDGDFKDLTTSDDFTTLMLSDGTRVTFKAKDTGVIEQVDIFKGTSHVKGTGQAAKNFSPENGLFLNKTLDDGNAAASATPLGDVVYAGGDGNDWFDAQGKLVWGRTTAPVVTRRPSATLEFYYRQTVSQSMLARQTVASA